MFQGLGVLVALFMVLFFYAIIGPLLLIIAARIVMWLGGVFGLTDALGVFGAEVHRAFASHRRLLDREYGAAPQSQ